MTRLAVGDLRPNSMPLRDKTHRGIVERVLRVSPWTSTEIAARCDHHHPTRAAALRCARTLDTANPEETRS